MAVYGVDDLFWKRWSVSSNIEFQAKLHLFLHLFIVSVAWRMWGQSGPVTKLRLGAPENNLYMYMYVYNLIKLNSY